MFRAQDLLLDPERFLKERFGFGVLAHFIVQPCQATEAGRSVWMFRAQYLLPDPERFLQKRFGFGVVAHIIVQQS